MISFDLDHHTFHLRAAAVIIRQEQVLLHRLAGDTVWALPGGRVEPGEPAASATVREMLEETGEAIDCGGLLFVVENFFEHKGRSQHEVGLYFGSTLSPDSRLNDMTVSHAGIEGGKVLEFRWFALSDLSHVNLHPAFLRLSLAAPNEVVRHVIQGR